MPSPLGSIYSTADSFKRKLLDMITNPVASAQQVVGNANDRASLLNALTSQAATEGLDGGPLMGPKSQQLAGMMADAYSPAGMFIGPVSKLWKPDMAFEAQKMLKRGATPQEVWQATRTGIGPDGQMRQEFSTAGTQFNAAPGTRRVARNVLPDENLYASYPELGSLPVRQGVKDDGTYGSLSPGSSYSKRGRKMSITERGMQNDPRSTFIHEMQHGIQDIEGFGAGGNASMAGNMRREAQIRSQTYQDQMDIIKREIDSGVSPDRLDELTRQYKQMMVEQKLLEPIANMSRVGGYSKMGGEAEARLAEARRDLTDDQLTKYFPFEQKSDVNPYGYDVDPSQLWNIDQRGNLMLDENKRKSLMQLLGL